MFNLEKAIAAWRRSFRYRRVFFDDDLEELERHLRDHVAGLVERGWSEKEAFGEALRGVGEYGAMETEYRKVYWGKLRQKRSQMRELTWRLTMLRNYLKVAFRSLKKQKGYAFINVVGLAVGTACCILILLFVQHERSYDRFHTQADDIYRLLLERPGQPLRVRTEYRLAPALQADYPFVQQSVRMSWQNTHFVTHENEVFKETRVFYVDSTFFDLFSFPLLLGDPETVLDEPDALVLSETIARKYFGREDPVGRTLIFDQSRELMVTGVAADAPSNSHFQFDFLIPMSVYRGIFGSQLDEWSTAEIYTYIRLSDTAAQATLASQFAGFVERHIGPEVDQTYRLQPLTDIHLHSTGMARDIAPQGDIRYVYVFSTIALLILMIACINFINMTTARSAQRSKEVGMRKVVGAHRAQLIKQFLSESFLISVLAVLIGFVLAAWVLPVLNELTGKALVLGDVAAHWEVLAALAVLVGLLAGGYPAFVLSRFRPAAVLRGALPRGVGGRGLRNGLVIFQFAVTGMLIFGALVVYLQLDYMRSKDLGFDKEQVVVVRVPGREIGSYPRYRQAIQTHPAIVNVAGSSHVPPATWGYPRLQPQGSDSVLSVKLFSVDFEFIDLFGLEMAAGRRFSRDFPTDTTALMLNETAVRRLGWNTTTALGRQASLSWVNVEGPVIGVVKDFHFRSLRDQIQPAAFVIAPNFFWNVVVKIRSDDPAGVLAFLDETWQAVVPGWPFEYSFLDQQLDEQYQQEAHLGRLVGYLTVLSIFLACLGLFGLAAFTAERRTKEIGVRKVLGASVGGLVVLLAKDITRLVAVALILAIPVGYLTASRWLEDFAYPIDLSWQIFFMVGVITLLIAILTVSYQSIKAALANPVETLRYE